MYQSQNKQIVYLSDYDIGELLKSCFDLFGQPVKHIEGFIYLLKQKFGYIKDQEIKDGVTNYVSGNFSDRHTRFTPSVLAHIINSRNKNQQIEYKTYETTPEQREYYKQKYNADLYMDFEDYCNKIPPSRIFIWRFLAGQFLEKELIFEQEYEKASEKDCQTISFQSAFKPLCLKVFNDLAMQGKKISDFIY